MSILSKIRSWFGRAGSLPITPTVSETSPQKATQEIKEQDSKAEKIVEAMKVAYEEQPRNDPVQPLAIQPESIPVPDTPKAEENTPPQDIQVIQAIQPIQPILPESAPSDTQSIQPELKVKRSSRSKSNRPARSRSRKKLKEITNPQA